jgi:hydroxymethylpyrimidine pyrophosphatase-like HAD family hydrolase
MYFLAVATDYDGTMAHDGSVNAETVAALKRCKESGRRLILVTGRELPSLKRAFSELKLFDRVVAENGALIYDPSTEEERVIAAAPPAIFVERLKERNIHPLSVGNSIVATWEPHQTAVLEVIRELGLELQIIFNKGAVMVLPPGTNKAAGLLAALLELELSPQNVVGIGDAENDHSFMHACGCAAAVANALPMVKEAADICLDGDHGAGVIELVEKLIREDARIVPRERHGIRLGTDHAGDDVYIEPHRGGVLIAGSSGIGKSTLATALTEHMAERGFEFCVFDPEGDYTELENAISVGDSKVPPNIDEALKLLRKAEGNVVINTQSLAMADRPAFFARLLPKIAELRGRTGRPHWLIVDEAHHLLPASRGNIAQMLPEDVPSVIFITVHPDAVSIQALRTVDAVIALGDKAADVISQFCGLIGVEAPGGTAPPGDDEVLFWERNAGRPVRAVKADRPLQTRRRHTRKYAEGELGADRSFYFRGPKNTLNLRAQNLILFLQIAEGVDDETWEHHLRAGHYSEWFRDVIKDADLALEAAEVEEDASLSVAESRKRISEAVTQRYTGPSKGSES